MMLDLLRQNRYLFLVKLHLPIDISLMNLNKLAEYPVPRLIDRQTLKNQRLSLRLLLLIVFNLNVDLFLSQT